MTLNAYRAWLQQRERSAGTIEKYLRDTARFFRETGAPDAPPKEAVAAWRDDLARRGYCAASVNAMLAAVNGYQEFRGAPEAKARPLKRTLLVLQTLCATGIRVSELPFITAEAVRRGRAAIRCKGKCREILLPAELCKRLGRWCSRRRIHTGPVFLSRSGRPLDRITVWKMMKALCERAGVAREKVFPHNLRHLFARTFYGLEKNLAKLADLLGHSSIETTRIYIMESGAEHRRLLDRMHLLL